MAVGDGSAVSCKVTPGPTVSQLLGTRLTVVPAHALRNPPTLSPITCWNDVTGIRVPRGSLSRAQDDYEAAATTCDNRRCLEALPYGARAVHWWVHNRAPRAITFPSDPGRPKAQCKASYHLLTSLQPSTCTKPSTATTVSKPSCAHGWVLLMDGHFSSGWILKKCPL